MFDKRHIILLGCLAIPFLLRAQPVVTITPQRPMVGDTVTFTYNPKAPGAKLNDGRQVTISLFPHPRPSVRNVVSFPNAVEMDFQGGVWRKRIVFDNPAWSFFTYWYMCGSNFEDTVDGWKTGLTLYGQDGKPLPDAHLAKYYALMGLNIANRDSIQTDELKRESELYPQNFRVCLPKWYKQWNGSENHEELGKQIQKSADSLFVLFPAKLDALVACVDAYRLVGDTTKSEMLENRILSMFPLSADAEVLRLSRLRKETNTEKRTSLLTDWLETFPYSTMAAYLMGDIEEYYESKGDTITARKISDDWRRNIDLSMSNILRVVEEERGVEPRGDRAELPDFVAEGLNGRSIGKKSFAGEVLILDFWATWCKSCLEIFPQLQKLWDAFRQHKAVGFLAINVSYSGDSLSAVQRFVQDNHYAFPVALDTCDLSGKMGISAIPVTMVIDKKGLVAFRSLGYTSPQKYFSEMTSIIQKLLDE